MPAVWNKVKRVLPLVILQFVLGAYSLVALPGASPWTILVPLPEYLLVLIILFGSHGLPRWGRGLLKLIAAALLGLLLIRFAGELFFRIIYMQSFSIPTDLQLIPGLLILLFGDLPLSPQSIQGLAYTLTIFVFGVLGWLLALWLERKLEGMNPQLPGVLFLGVVSISFLFPTRSMGVSFVAQRRLLKDSISQMDEANSQHTPQKSESPYQLPVIQDKDIHFFVIESYGSTLYSKEEYRDVILPLYRELEQAMGEDRWEIRSGLVRSPAFGGRSWLADASLLTGIQLENQALFDRTISQGTPAYFLGFINQRGYRRTYAAPGTYEAPQDWKQAYPFENYLLRYDFLYQGPFLSFGAMSDQFFLDFVGRNILKPEEKDFVLYLMVSSHVPFEVIPQYKEDWDFARGGKEYQDGYVDYFSNNWLGGNELAQGYLAGIEYSLRTIFGYMERHLNNDGFILIIGDHQPRKPVSVPQAGYLVPFHILYPKDLPLVIPSHWELSSSLLPPDLPEEEDLLPQMSAIPYLIQDIITRQGE